MEESTGVGGEKEGKGGLLGVGWAKTTKRTSDHENMSVYETRVPVGSQTFVKFSYSKQKFFCVRRNTSQSDQTENSFLLTEKKHSYIHTIVWIYASRAEHKNRITNSDEGVKEKVYT